jgi:hypothetical protein
MKNIEAIVIRGDFTKEEFAKLVALIREIDAHRPDGHFEIVAISPTNTSLEIAERELRDAVPDLPGRVTDFSVWKRR